MARNWKRVTPTSLGHAMELCIEYAKDCNPKFSIDRLAEALGLQNKFNIYKWQGNGRLPLILIKPFECFCGINLITRYLVHSEGNLIITVPTGRKATNKEINTLSLAMNETVCLLMKFYDEKTTAPKAVGAIFDVMESLAWHKINIEKADQPELEFNPEES